ncbi:unnamed protein product [Cylindrotheca closterium]|uniref:Uncharacterized protein n=1 Tax=Cylindrotheca closterium TaxID=2856 RepID=A0AAD2G904_9STRA|nr:unnamed protein product [Cylindrotheca closterium]
MPPSVDDYGEASVELECSTNNDNRTAKPIIITSANSQGMKRRVSFSDKTDIRHIESTKSISKKERKTRWMMGKDFLRIKEDCDNEMMRIFNSQKPCMRTDLRGLELFDPESICRSRSKHRKVVNAVIRMQDKQSDKGGVNPESIREMYCYLVQDSQDDARAIAWIDREVVEDYMATTMTEFEKVQQRNQRMSQLKAGSSNKSKGTKPALRHRLLKSFRMPKKVPSN